MSLKDIFTRNIEVFSHNGEITVRNASDSTITDVRVMFGNPAGVLIDPVIFTADAMEPGEERVAAKVSSVDPESEDRTETIDAEYECRIDGEESKNTLKVSVDI